MSASGATPQSADSTAESGFAGYCRGDLRADVIAGLTVAVMGVPQAMAYAIIAEVPPIYGLYTAIIPCLVAAILGSSNHLVTGPTNALCMVLLSLTTQFSGEAGVEPWQAILLLTFMAGFIQLGFGVLRLGGIIRYVSNSVVIGFTAGAGILIAANQLKNVFGIETGDARAFYEVIFATVRGLPDLNPYAFAIGFGTTALIVVLSRLNKKIPGALVGVGVTGVISYLFGWHGADMAQGMRVEIIRDIQPIAGSLPGFKLPELVRNPDFDLIRVLAMGALSVAVLGLIEAASIGRAVAASSGQRLDFNREFLGQGASKMIGSCFGAFASSGSFTRTAVCYKSGGKTRMAAAFSAGWTALALLVLGPVANFIPKAALAGLLITIAYTMVDKRRLGLTWRSGRNPRFVLVGTLASTLILPLQYAIFVGIALSIVILLRTTGRTYLTQLVPRDDSGIDEVPFQRAAPSPVATVNMEGALYFAAAEDLDYELFRCITPETRVVVLRMKRLRAVGSTAMAMLEHFWELLRHKGITLVVCGIEEELEGVITSSRVRRILGEQNIFYADNKLLQSTELALARAWSIVELERRISRGSAPDVSSPDAVDVTAAKIMSTRCIRFGNQHQLREAVWLMSGLQEHTKSLSPEPLFLQSREAKLFGELSPWRILEVLRDGVLRGNKLPRDDSELGERLRHYFEVPINELADVTVENHKADSPLAALVATALRKDMQVIPICDDEGRIKGLVSTDDLLRGLHQALAAKGGGDV